jgi:hypothetical protein
LPSCELRLRSKTRVLYSAGKGVITNDLEQNLGVLKRLDNRLSDAVYLHGCYLTGQEKIVRYHAEDEGKAHSQESSNASGIHAPDRFRIDGRNSFNCRPVRFVRSTALHLKTRVSWVNK